MRTLKYLCVIFLLTIVIYGAVPHKLHFQGHFEDEFGDAYHGSYTVTISILETESGPVLWEETRTVEFVNGHMSIYMGEVEPIPSTIFSGDSRFLAVSFDSTDFEPTELITVPYSFRSVYTDTAGWAAHVEWDSIIGLPDDFGADADWEISGDDMRSMPLGNIGIGIVSPDTDNRLHVVSGGDTGNRAVYGEYSETGPQGWLGTQNYGAYGQFDSENYGALGTSGIGIQARGATYSAHLDGDVNILGNIEVPADASLIIDGDAGSEQVLMSDVSGSLYWGTGGSSPDDDSDPTNEYNTSFTWNDATNDLTISDGGGDFSVILDNEADDLSDNSIGDLSDVVLTGLTADDFLVYDGSEWVVTSTDEFVDEADPLFTAMDTEAELEVHLADVANVYTDLDGELDDDDLSDNVIGDLGNVDETGVSDGSILVFDDASGNWEAENGNGLFIQNQRDSIQTADSRINGQSEASRFVLTPDTEDTSFTPRAGMFKTVGSGDSYRVLTYDGECWREMSLSTECITGSFYCSIVGLPSDTITTCSSFPLTISIAGGTPPYNIDWSIDSLGDWGDAETITFDVLHLTDTLICMVRDGESDIVADTLVVSAIFDSSTWVCGCPIVDFDGNVYQTIEIGEQCWMAENLKTTHYRDGTPIPLVTDAGTWAGLSSGAYCEYDNDPTNVPVYGRLYNWFAVDDAHGLAPDGWHVPTDDEWKELEMFLGMSEAAADSIGFRGTNEGSKMAGGYDLWISGSGSLRTNAAFNESGLILLPAGCHTYYGTFLDISSDAFCWSTSAESLENAAHRRLNGNNTDVLRDYGNKRDGYSVRCVLGPESSPLDASINGIPSDTLSTCSSYELSISVTGGTPPYTYDWNIDSLGDWGEQDTITYNVLHLHDTLICMVRDAEMTIIADTIIVNAFYDAESWVCGCPIMDIDSNLYQTVEIGEQCWMAENLKVTHYRDGTPIPLVTDAGTWAGLSSGAYCEYDNDPTNVPVYGRLYNWYAVDDAHGLAPDGWHVPTDDEWKELEMFLGMSEATADSTNSRGTNQGSKLASREDLWDDGNLESDLEFAYTEFAALPGGSRSSEGYYMDEHSHARLWSSSFVDISGAWTRILRYDKTSIHRGYEGLVKQGYSVRCILDPESRPLDASINGITSDTVSTCSSYDLSISVTGGTPPYTYDWNIDSLGDWDDLDTITYNILHLHDTLICKVRDAEMTIIADTIIVNALYDAESWVCGCPIMDIDSNLYQTVEIGEQCWMAENLKTTHYRDGTPIPHETDAGTWAGLSSGAYCEYDNDPANVPVYGRLYNWFAVDDAHGLAPDGWHVPTDYELMNLEIALGMTYSEASDAGYRGTGVGSRLSGNAALWSDNVLDSDGSFGTSGFDALPGGLRHYDGGVYLNVNDQAHFWTLKENDPTTAWFRFIDKSQTGIYKLSYDKRFARSVRCIRNSIEIKGGRGHTVALRDDGTVWAWGLNADGQLGCGDNDDRETPVQVLDTLGVNPLEGVNAIAAGGGHTLALLFNGRLLSWGHGDAGELGDGETLQKNFPVPVINSEMGHVVEIACGHQHSVALCSDGSVWTWGINNYGQLGRGFTSSTATPFPVRVVGIGAEGWLTDIVHIDAGYDHCLAVKNDGTVYAWGDNGAGQLGDGSAGGVYRTSPMLVLGVEGSGTLTNVTSVSGGRFHSLALKNDGTVYSWGNNSYGQLGNASTAMSTTPVQVVDGAGYLTDVISVSAGFSHSVVLKSDGSAWAWGDHSFGQLGNGAVPPSTMSSHPTQIIDSGGSPLTDIIIQATGYSHTINLDAGGNLWTCGRNSYGQIGDGTTTDRNTSQQTLGGATGETYFDLLP